MRVTIQREDTVGYAFADDGVGVSSGTDSAKRFECLEIEHDHCGVRQRRTVGTLDAGDLTNCRPRLACRCQ